MDYTRGFDHHLYDNEKNYQYYLQKAKEKNRIPEEEAPTVDDYMKLSKTHKYDNTPFTVSINNA